jgi:exopolysaccharide biosynthesis polyprenyl glycosylphosphotransferase
MQRAAQSEAITDDAVETAKAVPSGVEAGHRGAEVEVGHRPTRILPFRGPRRRLSTPTVPEAGISPVWEGISDRARVGWSWGYPASLRRDAIFRRALAVADVAAAYAALLIATLLVGGGGLHMRVWAFLIAPLVVVASKAIGLYDRDQHTLRKTTIDELPSILHISVFYALTVWLTQVVLLTGSLGRPEVFALVAASFLLMTFGRVAARNLALTACPAERCLVVGSAADTQRAAVKLSGSPGVKAAVVGRIAVDPRERSHDILGNLSDGDTLVRVIADERIDRVIVAPDGHDEDEILDVIRKLKAVGVKVSVLPRLLEVVGSSSTFDDIDGMTLLGVRQAGLSASSRFLKRAMDLAVASAALLLLAPLLLAIAALIKIDSRGPVFFSQWRIGRGGHRFRIYKFRSMIADAESAKDALRQHNEVQGGMFKITKDPRITRVGRFLRPTSLDELPQLLNVLLGDMSLVGPRPLVPDEDALIEGWKRRRLTVRPGITGLWQIFGSSRIPLPEMVKIDYFYCANWSVWVDTKILLRTIPYVIRRRGR